MNDAEMQLPDGRWVPSEPHPFHYGPFGKTIDRAIAALRRLRRWITS